MHPMIPQDLTERRQWIELNAHPCATRLVPELRLMLMRPDAPLYSAPVYMFDFDGVRPYWAFAWGGGQALARYLLDHPSLVQGRTVLDVGAGSGIAALAAARAGAAQVAAMDIDPAACMAIQMNAELNNLDVRPWQADIQSILDGRWDVILVGDVYYHFREADWMSGWGDLAPTVLLGDNGHRGMAEDHLELLQEWTVRTEPELEHHSIRRARVLRVLKGT